MGLFGTSKKNRISAAADVAAVAASGLWASGAANNLAPFVPVFIDSGPVTRAQAMRVPAVLNGLQVIAGTLSTVPLCSWRANAKLADADATAFVSNPDPTVPVSWHYAQTLTDAVLFGVAYWVVTGRDSTDRITTAQYVVAEDVDLSEILTTGNVRVGLEDIPAADVLQFLGPITGGICDRGATAIRTAYLLELAAARFATLDVPAGVLENLSAVELDTDEIAALLADWEAARAARTTAYLQGNLKYSVTQFDAAQLQLVEGRRESDSKIAQLLNLPPQYVNAPVAGGSMVYSNLTQRRRDLFDLSLAPWSAAITDRLSMDDITPRGQSVRPDLGAFYRADIDTLTAMGTAGTAAGLFSIDEWRAWAGLDTTTPATPPTIGTTP